MAGPAIGGLLAYPPFWRETPFLLPMLINAGLGVIAIILEYFFLPETLGWVSGRPPSLAAQLSSNEDQGEGWEHEKERSNSSDTSALLTTADEGQKVSERVSLSKRESEEDEWEEIELVSVATGTEAVPLGESVHTESGDCDEISLRDLVALPKVSLFPPSIQVSYLLTSSSVCMYIYARLMQVRGSVAAYCLISYVSIVFDEVFSLWCSTPSVMAFSEQQIGAALVQHIPYPHLIHSIFSLSLSLSLARALSLPGSI